MVAQPETFMTMYSLHSRATDGMILVPGNFPFVETRHSALHLLHGPGLTGLSLALYPASTRRPA